MHDVLLPAAFCVSFDLRSLKEEAWSNVENNETHRPVQELLNIQIVGCFGVFCLKVLKGRALHQCPLSLLVTGVWIEYSPVVKLFNHLTIAAECWDIYETMFLPLRVKGHEGSDKEDKCFWCSRWKKLLVCHRRRRDDVMRRKGEGLEGSMRGHGEAC